MASAPSIAASASSATPVGETSFVDDRSSRFSPFATLGSELGDVVEEDAVASRATSKTLEVARIPATICHRLFDDAVAEAFPASNITCPRFKDASGGARHRSEDSSRVNSGSSRSDMFFFLSDSACSLSSLGVLGFGVRLPRIVDEPCYC